MILSDIVAERAVLAGIARYGETAYYDVIDFLQESTFTEEINQAIFKCFKSIFDNNDNVKIDLPTIYSVSQDLGLQHFFVKNDGAQHLQAILNLPIELTNIRRHAGKIRKLEIANLLHQQLGIAQGQLLEITGNESIASILGIAEDAVFGFVNTLNDDNDLKPVGDGLKERIQYLADNQVEQIGISTNLPAYDFAIGGGLRSSSVNVVGGRTKSGKSMLVGNIAHHITKNLNIPVLILDTEMCQADVETRLLAMMTETNMGLIETGKFANTPETKDKINNAVAILEQLPLTHKNIVGTTIEEQLSLARRWITKTVGVNDDGTAKSCVIVYDYLQLTQPDDIQKGLQEYQQLGFTIKALHSLAVRYKLPILCTVQLNRDGQSVESTTVISASDRIAHTCSNFTILKAKIPEEVAEDGPNEGNIKLVPIIARHGPGVEQGNYINCEFKGWCAKITEKKTKFELVHNSQNVTTQQMNF